MIKTDPSQYYFPPRPDKCVPNDQVGMFFELGWRPQLKFNDSRALIKVFDGKMELWNRHGERMRSYTVPDFLSDQVLGFVNALGLDPSGYHVFDGGLLDQKHCAIKDCLVIWDVLVEDGEYLIGSSYLSRFERLLGCWRRLGCESWFYRGFKFGLSAGVNLFIPEYFSDGFDSLWDFVLEVNRPFTSRDGSPLLEGLVIKDPCGVLQLGYRVKNNTDWLVKSRVSTGRHRF